MKIEDSNTAVEMLPKIYMTNARRFFLLFLSTLCLLFSSCSKKECTAIARDPTWHPEDLSGKTNQVNAFTNAITQKISELEKTPLQILDTNWNSLIEGLEKGTYKAIFSSLVPNGENLEKYDFSDPFLKLGPVLVLPLHSNAGSLEDLKGSIVGISSYDDSVLIVQKFPSILIKTYDNMSVAIEALINGEIEGVLLPNLQAQGLIATHFVNALRIASEPLDNKGLRIVTLKGKNKKTIKVFNSGLKKLQKSKVYDELYRHYDLL